MVGVSPEPSMECMTDVADGYVADQEIDCPVDGGHSDQRQHGVEGLVASEENDTDENTDYNDRQTEYPIEIFLNV